MESASLACDRWTAASSNYVVLFPGSHLVATGRESFSYVVAASFHVAQRDEAHIDALYYFGCRNVSRIW
jgi:hypothetical protein